MKLDSSLSDEWEEEERSGEERPESAITHSLLVVRRRGRREVKKARRIGGLRMKKRNIFGQRSDAGYKVSSDLGGERGTWVGLSIYPFLLFFSDNQSIGHVICACGWQLLLLFLSFFKC